MGSFLFALNAVAPIIIMVAVGYLLKKIGFMDADLAKKINKLVFRIFIPVMLFVNIYEIENIGNVNFGYVIYTVVAVIAIFLLALPLALATTKSPKSRGALLQSSFRSNYALIGIPLAQSLFGAEGGAVAAILSAFVVPVFNILAVISLSIFQSDGKRPSVKKTLVGMVNNPLIHGVALGLAVLGVRALLVNFGIDFRLSEFTAGYKVLEYLKNLATPLALLVLGAQFEFSAVSGMKKEIIVGTLVRVAVVPLLGVGMAYLLFRDSFTGAHFAALVAAFATPVAVSSVPMAQEMDSDVTLAGQLVVWTTIASAISIFLISFALSLIGVFPTI